MQHHFNLLSSSEISTLCVHFTHEAVATAGAEPCSWCDRGSLSCPCGITASASSSCRPGGVRCLPSWETWESGSVPVKAEVCGSAQTLGDSTVQSPSPKCKRSEAAVCLPLRWGWGAILQQQLLRISPMLAWGLRSAAVPEPGLAAGPRRTCGKVGRVSWRVATMSFGPTKIFVV